MTLRAASIAFDISLHPSLLASERPSSFRD